MPNAHYVSPEVFEEERQAVLFDHWAGVGFGKDVPEIGDAMPVDFLGMPLLIVRDREGEVGVFQNTCRHRGMILVEEPRKIEGAIRCPYHSWCYSLKGELKSTPHVGGPGHNTHAEIKREELGLIRMPSYVWHDVIYVNVNGNAAPFEEVHAELLARWAEFEGPMVHGGAASSFKLEVATNWKLAVENYCESYHLPWVHPGLNSYSRLEDHYNIEKAGEYSGQGTLVYRQLQGDDGATFPVLATILSSGRRARSILPSIRMCFWASTGTITSRLFWSRKRSARRLSMWRFIIRKRVRRTLIWRRCGRPMRCNGKACSWRMFLWLRACKRGVTGYCLMGGNSRP